jgi:AhpD family alkylhydroperoxidase
VTATPRLAPLAASELADEQRDLLRGRLPAADRYLTGDPDGPPLPNILGLFAHHPQLAAHWLAWNAALLETTTISPHDRELLILRVAWRTQCHYEWAQHVAIARDAGVTDAELAALATDDAAGVDLDLVSAADQMLYEHGVDERIWTRLALRFDPRELLEVLFLVGSYAALAQVLNSVHLPPDACPDGSVTSLPPCEDRS